MKLHHACLAQSKYVCVLEKEYVWGGYVCVCVCVCVCRGTLYKFYDMSKIVPWLNAI